MFTISLLSWSPARTLSSRELDVIASVLHFSSLGGICLSRINLLYSPLCALQYPRAIGVSGIQNNYSATFLCANVFNRGMIRMAKSFNEYKLLEIPASSSTRGWDPLRLARGRKGAARRKRQKLQ